MSQLFLFAVAVAFHLQLCYSGAIVSTTHRRHTLGGGKVFVIDIKSASLQEKIAIGACVGKSYVLLGFALEPIVELFFDYQSTSCIQTGLANRNTSAVGAAYTIAGMRARDYITVFVVRICG